MQQQHQGGVKRAVIKEECPKCRAPEMEFYTMQLRSADEGQTVFYECFNPKCGHKYSVNT
jgi:DNA-directed RNA polymerase I subunit RPA12